MFAGKLGFMTLRDLFRWAERYKCFEMEDAKFYNWDKHLADQGNCLISVTVCSWNDYLLGSVHCK